MTSAALAVLLLALAPSPQDHAPLVAAGLRDLLHESLSGERALDHVIAITRHNRVQGARGYRAAAEYVLAELRKAGLSPARAFVESYPSDGRTLYQGWPSPSGWDAESAELRMLEPVEERIVGYPEIGMSLMTYSNAGHVTAELVHVGRGTRDADYAGVDVRGKLVLATGYGGAVHRLAVAKHGAAAVVCYLDDERAADYPDMLAYTGIWPRPNELEGVTFGFNLTNRQGEGLRRRLAAGERVVLQADVRGVGLEPYFMDVVVATFPGAELPAEELVLVAHLDHPKESANDNASGSAALLDIVRALEELVRAGRLAPPRRTLRFLWVPEYFGTMAYIDAHPELVGPELGGSVLAGLNLDMVGENQDLLHSQLIATRTPDSLPTCLPDLIENLCEMVERMQIRTPRGSRSSFDWRVTPYSGYSDHVMLIDRKVPAVMLGHDPDYTHHTSEDTPDKVDPVELERSELIGLAAALHLSDLSPEQAIDLAQLVAGRALDRLHRQATTLARGVRDAGEGGLELALAEARNALEYAFERERAALGSVLRYRHTPAVEEVVYALQDNLRAARRTLEELVLRPGIARGIDPVVARTLSVQIDWGARVPLRRTRGPIYVDLPEIELPPERLEWYSSGGCPLDGDARFELVNRIDGERNVSLLRNALSAQFGPLPLDAIERYLDDLVAVGALAWKEPEAQDPRPQAPGR